MNAVQLKLPLRIAAVMSVILLMFLIPACQSGRSAEQVLSQEQSAVAKPKTIESARELYIRWNFKRGIFPAGRKVFVGAELVDRNTSKSIALKTSDIHEVIKSNKIQSGGFFVIPGNILRKGLLDLGGSRDKVFLKFTLREHSTLPHVTPNGLTREPPIGAINFPIDAKSDSDEFEGEFHHPLLILDAYVDMRIY